MAAAVCPTVRCMLTDSEIQNIRQGVREGLRGPVLTKWLEMLLAERQELLARLRAAERRTQEPAAPVQAPETA